MFQSQIRRVGGAGDELKYFKPVAALALADEPGR